MTWVCGRVSLARANDRFLSVPARRSLTSSDGDVTQWLQRLQAGEREEALGDEVLRTVALAKMEGETNRAIAAKLGVAEITVERKLAGCRDVLEKCLQS